MKSMTTAEQIAYAAAEKIAFETGTRYRIEVDGKMTGGEWLAREHAADYCRRQVRGSWTVVACDIYGNPK